MFGTYLCQFSDVPLWVQATILHFEAKAKCTPSCRHFQTDFLQWKWLYSDLNFTEICSAVSNWQQAITGSDNGLAPIRQWTVVSINEDLIWWHIYVSLCLNDLTHWCCVTHICVTKSGCHLLRRWLVASYKSSLVQIMAWRQSGNEPLPQTTMT